MIRVAAAVIIRDGKVLLASRPADKPPAGWEFPGGKLEPGEDLFAAAVRELREELALEIEPEAELYTLTRPGISIGFVRCRIVGDSAPRPCEGQQVKWADIVPEMPADMLENDREFWIFLNSVK